LDNDIFSSWESVCPYKVFFQPPIFDIRIDNSIHKGDRIFYPSEYSTNPVLRARKFSIGGLTT
ncbi:hypothetical protein, partial [Cylindrospermopsis raciborskii]|uniref:hypothetical protein n=1 Tax=Cylindrospermopsis raciborskii TaxID=77022 RepID=UPI001CA5D5ED